MVGYLKVSGEYYFETTKGCLNSECNDTCATTCSSFSTFKDSGCHPNCPWEEDTDASIKCAGWYLLLVMGILYFIGTYCRNHLTHGSYKSYLYIAVPCSTDDPCVNGGTCKAGICHCTSDCTGSRCQHGNNFDICL